MRNEATTFALVIAQGVINRESMWLLERVALRRLTGHRGVARMPLVPPHDVIQIVTRDGRHVGHGRLDGPRGPDERWRAIRPGAARPLGTYATAADAAEALASDSTPDHGRHAALGLARAWPRGDNVDRR
jgi:hypothetical protein